MLLQAGYQHPHQCPPGGLTWCRPCVVTCNPPNSPTDRDYCCPSAGARQEQNGNPGLYKELEKEDQLHGQGLAPRAVPPGRRGSRAGRWVEGGSWLSPRAEGSGERAGCAQRRGTQGSQQEMGWTEGLQEGWGAWPGPSCHPPITLPLLPP